MGKHILLSQGHPDASQRHLCHALEDAYIQGANVAGHEIQRITVAPVNETLIGMAGNMEEESAGKWLTKLEKLGENGD